MVRATAPEAIPITASILLVIKQIVIPRQDAKI
jgi:hypothetical protein